jgi:hypothetical protein
VGRLLGHPEVWGRGGEPEAPRLQVQTQVLHSAGLGGGPLLVSRSGRLVDGRPVELDPDSVGGPVA